VCAGHEGECWHFASYTERERQIDRADAEAKREEVIERERERERADAEAMWRVKWQRKRYSLYLRY
jgi:hypothetical protein